MVDVQHGSLRAFVKDTLAGGARGIHFLPDSRHERQYFRRHLDKLRQQILGRGFGLPEPAEQGIMMQQQGFDTLNEDFRIGQITNPDGAACGLVLVRRADAAPGRTDLGLAQGGFARLIQVSVQWQ